MSEHPPLRRHLGTLTLTLYGVGVIVGAGIYVLVGSVAALVGNGVWLALLGAGLAALPTGLSYAELSSRYPRSAGEAVFAGRAFGRPALSFVVGFLVLASGVVSTAALSHGFSRYFSELTGFPDGARILLVVGFLGALSLVNHRGIRESTWLNVACTVLSLLALALLVFAGLRHWGSVDLLDFEGVEGTSTGPGLGMLAAAALAFYAFIGFEDICNVAEEVEEPQKTIPRAILGSLLISGVVYACVAITAVSTISAAELARSEVPLADVAHVLLPSLPNGWLSVVAILAVSNSALFNLIMVSRIFYGMSREGLLPRQFARVHRKRQTPTWGVVAACVLAVGFGTSGFFEVLVEATNILLLAVFFVVNLSLVVVRWRGVPPDDPSSRHFVTPVWVAIFGMLATAWMILQFSAGAYLRAGVALMVGLVLYVARRWGSRMSSGRSPSAR